MKKLSWFFMLAFMAYACQLQNADESVLSPDGLKSAAVSVSPDDACGPGEECDLKAGTDQIVVGSVKVSNNDDYLFIEFFANAGQTFNDSHLNISCEVPTDRGNPGGYNANDGYLDDATATDTYRLYIVPKSFITDLGCDEDCFNLLAHVAMGSGQTAMACNFVNPAGGSWFNYMPYCWQGCYEASGYVFKQECEEEAIPYEGVKVTLVQGTDTLTTYTDVNGYYLFENLGPATYRISVAGAVPEYIDNQYTTINNNFTVYFFAVSGTVYYDDCGDVAPLPDVTVTLKQGEDIVATTTTNEAGWYKFGWLSNGTYMLYIEGMDPVEVVIDGECFYEYDLTVVNEDCHCFDYGDETAWANGNRYVARGNWAMYTPFVANSTVIVYAGQTMQAGTVHFSSNVGGYVTITIELNEGWSLQDVMEAVKIQGYTTPPNKNPDPGLFTTYKGNELEVTVPYFAYYGIHVDAREWREVPCPE